MVKPSFKASIDLTGEPDAPPPSPEPVPVKRQEAGELKPPPIAATPPPPIALPVPRTVKACPAAPAAAASYDPNEPYDPTSLFQALLASFVTGAIVGGALVYAFSSTEVVELVE